MEIVCFLDRRPWDPAGGAGAAPVRPSPVAPEAGTTTTTASRSRAIHGSAPVNDSDAPTHTRARAHTRRKLTHPTPPPACLPARGRGHATAAAAGYREEFGGRATDAPHAAGGLTCTRRKPCRGPVRRCVCRFPLAPHTCARG